MNQLKEYLDKDTYGIVKDYVRDLVITDIDNKIHQKLLSRCMLHMSLINGLLDMYNHPKIKDNEIDLNTLNTTAQLSKYLPNQKHRLGMSDIISNRYFQSIN